MKKSFWTAVLLAVCMTVMLSFPAFAAEDSGTCGDNLTWKFDETTATLTISGTGEMEAGEYPPWSGLRKVIENLVVEDGVTSISHNAFGAYTKLKTVTLPPSLVTIGGGGFSGCSALKSINLTHLTTIGDYAFQGCSSLTSLTIPAGVTQINHGAFSNCTGLKKIILHDRVTVIDTDAFHSCTGITSITIPDSVKTIGGGAFTYCYRLSNVDLGNGVRELGANCFSRCPYLETITFPDSVVSIGQTAFSGCEALQEVIIGAGMKDVHCSAFDNCKKITGFILSEKNPHLNVDRGVLYTEDWSELVLMPDGFSGPYDVLPGTVEIGGYSCYGTGLTSVTIPSNVKTVDNYAFDACEQLEKVELSEGLEEIGTYAFARTPIIEITLPSTLKVIKQMAFSGCVQMEKMIFTGAPPEIAEMAFCHLTATVYHPENIPEWADAEHLYGGKVEWATYYLDLCTEGHTPVADAAKDATCTDHGLTAGSHCGVCGKTIKKQGTIPATGHTFGEWSEVTAATLESEGLSKRSCTDCSLEEEQIIPKLQPSETEATDPTQPSIPSETDPPEGNATLPEETTAPAVETAPDSDEQKSENGLGKGFWWAVLIAGCILLVCFAVDTIIVWRKKK